jgi:hypothetical protein
MLELGDIDCDAEGLSLADGDSEADSEAEGLMLAEGDMLADTDWEAEGLSEGDAEDETDEDGLIDGLTEALGDRLADGDIDELGDGDALGLTNCPGEEPYQSIPGRGPGLPSSYKNMLSATSRASLGSLDLSIRVITPFLQELRVRKFGSGKDFRRRLFIVRGI